MSELHSFFLRTSFIYGFFSEYLFIYLFLDSGEGREKEGEKHQCVVASRTPPLLGTWSTPQACVPWLGTEPATLWFTAQHSIHWAAPARTELHSFLWLNKISYIFIDRIFVYLFICGWTLGLFIHILAFMNNAAVNIGVQASAWVPAFNSDTSFCPSIIGDISLSQYRSLPHFFLQVLCSP